MDSGSKPQQLQKISFVSPQSSAQRSVQLLSAGTKRLPLFMHPGLIQRLPDSFFCTGINSPDIQRQQELCWENGTLAESVPKLSQWVLLKHPEKRRGCRGSPLTHWCNLMGEERKEKGMLVLGIVQGACRLCPRLPPAQGLGSSTCSAQGCRVFGGVNLRIEAVFTNILSLRTSVS